jgi:Bacterial SH3 domain./Tetratricopeptide repeat.
LLFANALVFANNNDSLWIKGNEAYAVEEYGTALDFYNQILDKGENSYNLYYNIGNSYYKMGEVGKAILYYEKALKLNPSGKDAKNNLEIAKLKTLDKVESVPEFFVISWIKGFRNSFSSDKWANISIIFIIITGFLLLLYKFASTSKKRKFSFVLACLTLLCFIISFIFALNLSNKASGEDGAIIMQPVSNVKSAPNATGNNIFILHEGTKVKILESTGSWCKIEILDGRQGWINGNDLEKI